MQLKPSKARAKTLLEAFTELPDPRVIERWDHLLHEVLVIAVCGMLVGGESFYDMEDFASESESWNGPERFTASRASKRARVSSVAATSSNCAALHTSASSRTACPNRRRES